MEVMRADEPNVPLFNGPLETGIRAVILLDAFYPRVCDLIEMTWLDHLVVHTSDLEGDNVPPSLHPDLPNRTGELLVRRQLIEKSLRLMQQVHLVNVIDTTQGISFVASEDAPSYIGLLQSPYFVALKSRAQWIAERFTSMESSEIKAFMEAKIGRWTAEFQSDQTPSNGQS